LLRSDRQQDGSHRHGGGVAVYIRDGIVHERHYFAEHVDPGLEYICVVLKVKGRRLGLCVVYRPPHLRCTHLAPLFHSLFVDLAVEVKSVICLGDMNVDLLSNSSCESNYLRRLLKDSNARQLIAEPTRVTAYSATLLDHIIVDRSVEVERTGVLDAPAFRDQGDKPITDHRLVYCNVICEREKAGPQLITYRDFSKFDLNEVDQKFKEVDWDSVIMVKGVNNIEKFITSNIRKIYDEHAPIVCKKVTKKKAPWRNEEIKKLTKEKNKLRNKYKRTERVEDWENYKASRNRLNNVIWRTKKEYFSSKLSSTENASEFWSCLKKCDIACGNNVERLPDEFKVDEINTYFADMGRGTDVDKDLVEKYRTNKHENVREGFSFKTVSEKEVRSAMNEIKSKAVGCDDISIEMIKAVSPYALGAITHLMNESLRTGVFPEAWKKSIVHPLPKVATPRSIQELRPISILPAMSKILEKIVARQINEYMKKIKILPRL